MPIHPQTPLVSHGSLVYYDFGWDLLTMLRQAGFARVRCLYRWEAATGHLGDGQPLFSGG